MHTFSEQETPKEHRAAVLFGRMLQAFEWFFDTWRFAAFALSLLFFFPLLVAGLLLIPPTQTSGLSSFALEFRTWCFGYDPATGKMDWSYVITFFSSPLMLAAVIWAIWGKKLSAAWHEQPRAILPYSALSIALVACCGLGFATLYKPSLQGELPFPAERLRTQHTPPAFVLQNQREQNISLPQFKGKVVLLTAVYSTCGYTCPMIFAQMKRAFAALTEAEHTHLRVLAITLDPKRDRPSLLRNAAKAHKLHTPFFHFLTGSPARVNRTLDDFSFARKRDPKTGQINHVNLFLLMDRHGRIAYRFSLGERQERWLIQALRLLIRETTTATPKA